MIEVATARPDQYHQALSLLLSHLGREEQNLQIAQLLDASNIGDLNFDGLLIAEVRNEPVGAALLFFQQDGTVFVWPPAVRRSGVKAKDFDDVKVADALLQEAARRIDSEDAWIGQCVLEPGEHGDAAALSRNGFSHLTDLAYLQRLLTEPLPVPSDVRFETVQFEPLHNQSRFARLLEQTYRGGFDCPELNGLRSGEQALTAHRSFGRFEPTRWQIYRVDGRDIGLLLVNERSDENAWEVVYMGLVPAARGRGYGRAMMLAGFNEALDSGLDSITLAVDVRNIPAKRVYKNLGFVEVAVRAVHARLPQRDRQVNC